jgi:hypothetical protein
MAWLRFLWRVVVSAAVGFAMVTVAVAIAEYASDRDSGYGPMALLVLLWVVGLPLVGWLLLRMFRVRPAGAIAMLAPITLFYVIRLWEGPRGGHGPPWQYGLRGVAAYAVTAVVLAGLVAAVESLGTDQPSAPDESTTRP